LRKEIERYDHKIKNGEDFLLKFPEQSTYEALFLEIGRPRLKTELILFFLIVRGLWGSISDYTASERIRDSISIHNVLAHYSYDVPGINTIQELLSIPMGWLCKYLHFKDYICIINVITCCIQGRRVQRPLKKQFLPCRTYRACR